MEEHILVLHVLVVRLLVAGMQVFLVSQLVSGRQQKLEVMAFVEQGNLDIHCLLVYWVVEF